MRQHLSPSTDFFKYGPSITYSDCNHVGIAAQWSPVIMIVLLPHFQ